MIRQLRAVLGPEHQGDYTRFLVWATIYGILQGFAVSLLVPVARALAAGDRTGTWTWLAVLAAAVLLCVAFPVGLWLPALQDEPGLAQRMVLMLYFGWIALAAGVALHASRPRTS